MADQNATFPTIDEPSIERPKWRRPEVSVLDVERGTLAGNGSASDHPAGATTS